jgi:tRNA (cmo5U34)-methyltransferase
MSETVTTSVGHAPAEKWEFDESVTAVFGDMLERSIPQYATMRTLVTDLAVEACWDAPSYSAVVDLGSSRGDALAAVVDRVGHVGGRRYYAVESSKPMLQSLRERFEATPVDVVDADLRQGVPSVVGLDVGVALSVLTLQFVPINYRQAIVQDVYDRMTKGGAFFLVEKVLGASALIDELLVDRYHALKGANGYPAEEIERKRMSLEGVLVPVTAAWNFDLLRQAGFRQVDCFWRWANFAGFVGIK